MCEELSYQIINISAVNQAVFCYYQKFAKIIIEKKYQCWQQAATKKCTFLNSFNRDLARVIQITLDISEFLNIHIFNWYKGLQSASSSTSYQNSSMASCSFTHGVFLKTDSYVFINTGNTEFYISLSPRQNESRYKVWY